MDTNSSPEGMQSLTLTVLPQATHISVLLHSPSLLGPHINLKGKHNTELNLFINISYLHGKCTFLFPLSHLNRISGIRSLCAVVQQSGKSYLTHCAHHLCPAGQTVGEAMQHSYGLDEALVELSLLYILP